MIFSKTAFWTLSADRLTKEIEASGNKGRNWIKIATAVRR